MGVKFTHIRKNHGNAFLKVTLSPQSPISVAFCAEMPELKVLLVLAALVAITAAARHCRLQMCTDQLGLTPEGNITMSRGGGRDGQAIDFFIKHCDDEIYISCNHEVNLNHSTCLRTWYMDYMVHGKKLICSRRYNRYQSDHHTHLGMEPCGGFCYEKHKRYISFLVDGCDYILTLMKMHDKIRKISGSSVILTIFAILIILILVLVGFFWLRWRLKEENDNRSDETYLTAM